MSYASNWLFNQRITSVQQFQMLSPNILKMLISNGLCPRDLAMLFEELTLRDARAICARLENIFKYETDTASSFARSLSAKDKKQMPEVLAVATELNSDILNQYSQEQTHPVTEIAIMQAINLLLKEQLKGFKFVSVVFNVAQPVHAQKVYTYKTNLEVAQDDYVVVQSPDGKFETVRVVEVDVAVTSQYEYKWIVAKLDMAPFEEVKAIEAEVKKILQDTERKKLEAIRTAQLKEELGEEGLEQVKKAVSRTRI